jgi:transposase
MMSCPADFKFMQCVCHLGFSSNFARTSAIFSGRPRKGWGMLTQEVVNMGRTRRAFTQEFKREAVKLVTESGHPTVHIARELGLTPNLLRRWKQEVAGDPVAAFPGKGRRKPHEEELARLKRDLARVTQERDFLKSVAAYFARPTP